MISIIFHASLVLRSSVSTGNRKGTERARPHIHTFAVIKVK